MRQDDFEKVYSDHKEMVWRLVSKYVSQRTDKEDLFQEVFLRVHRAFPGFRGDSNVATWIYRIAVNVSITHLQRLKRQERLREVLGYLGIAEVQEPDQPDPFEGAITLKPLEKLNPRQRMVLLLADVEERKIDEISEMLGMPAGTVKSNLHRAREIVKKEVEKDGEI